MKIRAHILISGMVRGVGFRHFIRYNAENLGIKGFVRNTNSKVEAVFEGERKDVEEIIAKCKKGPISSYVEKVEVKIEKHKGNFEEFGIIL